MEDIINDNNKFDYDNKRRFFEENDVITKLSDNNDEEKSNDEKESNNDEEESNNDEEESNNNEEKSNNNEEKSNNNEEESNNDEEERNNDEENGVHQIVEALDEDKIPSCDGKFALYFNNYTTAALFY